MIYFTMDDYFKHMVSLGYVPSMNTKDNAQTLLMKVNPFLCYLVQQDLLPENYQFILTSGWRSIPYNEKIGGAKNSNHCIGAAIDISKQDIVKLCEKDILLLERFDLYAESPVDTSKDGGWTHLQTVKPKNTGNRIFRA